MSSSHEVRSNKSDRRSRESYFSKIAELVKPPSTGQKTALRELQQS